MISNILFEYLLDQFPLGLYILDNQGRYIYTNDAYDRLLDLPREKLIMRSVHELMHDGHYDACISDIVFREKQPVSVCLNVFVDDGNTIKRVRHLVRAVPLFEPAGEISYMIGICEAVNDLNECYHEAIARTMVAQSTTFHQPLTQEHRHSTQMIAVSEVMQAVLWPLQKYGAGGFHRSDLRRFRHRKRTDGGIYPPQQPSQHIPYGGRQLRLHSGKSAGVHTVRL